MCREKYVLAPTARAGRGRANRGSVLGLGLYFMPPFRHCLLKTLKDRVHLNVTAEIDVDMLHFIVGVGCPRGVSRIQGGLDEIV